MVVVAVIVVEVELEVRPEPDDVGLVVSPASSVGEESSFEPDPALEALSVGFPAPDSVTKPDAVEADDVLDAFVMDKESDIGDVLMTGGSHHGGQAKEGRIRTTRPPRFMKALETGVGDVLAC